MAVGFPQSYALTRREREILHLLASTSCWFCGAQTLTNAAIADSLCITEGTVHVHLGNLCKKLRLRGRRQLARWANEQGLG